jgi:hypothetical protein
VTLFVMMSVWKFVSYVESPLNICGNFMYFSNTNIKLLSQTINWLLHFFSYFLWAFLSFSESCCSLTSNNTSKLYNKEPLSTNSRTELITEFPEERSRMLECYVYVFCSCKTLSLLKKTF